MGPSAQPALLTRLLPQRDQLLRRLLRAALARLSGGALEVVFPDGESLQGGTDTGPQARLIIRDARAFDRILRRGAIGFAEAYIVGEWESPDLAALLELAARDREVFAPLEGGRWLARVMNRLRHLARRNTRAGARLNIASHYDLGNEFYTRWLDPSMTYSCGLFRSKSESLEQAQANKYRAMLDRLQLQPGDTVLEIGCGWGSFALFAARERGCKVLGITLSRAQLEEARRRAVEADLADQVSFELRDYRDLEGQFDRIVSIEMFEAVGERYWPHFFRAIKQHLAPGGRAAMQVITIDPDLFPRYRRSADFIQRYIFPGGMLPSPPIFEAQAAAASLSTGNISFHGDDYERTLSLWDLRVFAARSSLLEMGYDTQFLRLWHYYLAYCIAGFRSGQIDLMQLELEHAVEE